MIPSYKTVHSYLTETKESSLLLMKHDEIHLKKPPLVATSVATRPTPKK